MTQRRANRGSDGNREAKRQRDARRRKSPAYRAAHNSIEAQFERRQKLHGWDPAFTVEHYEEMLDAQGGCCAICGAPPSIKRLAVDHDHATGAVRGLLCVVCNTVLGRFRDDAARFAAAARYLAGPT